MFRNIAFSILILTLTLTSILACSKSSDTEATTTVADVTPDFKQNQSPSTVVSVPGTISDKGTWTFGTSSSNPYTASSFVAFDTRSYDLSGFETYGYIHAAAAASPWLGKDCGRPELNQPAIRRWTSNFTGTVNVSGTVGIDTEHQSIGGSGTTTVTLYVDSTSVYTRDLPWSSDTQYSFSVTGISVAPGTKLDFVVSSTNSSPLIANFYGRIYY